MFDLPPDDDPMRHLFYTELTHDQPIDPAAFTHGAGVSSPVLPPPPPVPAAAAAPTAAVVQALDPTDDALLARGIAVKCPDLVCKIYYDDQAIANHVSREVYDKFTGAKVQLMERKLGEGIRKEERQRLEEEDAREAALTEEQRCLEKARKNIVDDILNLKCPRCKAAFIDFEGCFALKCDSCPCGFCACCLRDCGEDAHSHVASCKEGRELHSQYFGDDKLFKKIHQDRRNRLVRKFLIDIECDRLRKLVVEKCRSDLEDLGLVEIETEFGKKRG